MIFAFVITARDHKLTDVWPGIPNLDCSPLDQSPEVNARPRFNDVALPIRDRDDILE